VRTCNKYCEWIGKEFELSTDERLYAKIHDSFKKQNFMTLLGAELEHVEEGKVVFSCARKDTLTQQHGFIHGGVIATLADISCGYAANTAMPGDIEVLTVEFKINLVRPTTANKIVATGQVIKAGKTLVVVESTVTDESGELVIAKAMATMMAVNVRK
jgi:uncharacterized protein (TIGR00369 family)